MTKFTALFSAITALVVLSTSTAFADNTSLQCAMLKSSGQVLPPYCAQTTQPAPQAAAQVATKKSKTLASAEPTTAKPHTNEVTVTVDDTGTPKKIGYDTTATKMPIGKTHKPRRLAMR